MARQTFKLTALSTGVAIALGSAPPTLAQEEELEEIVVTGSHIRRTEYEGRAPIQIVDAEAIELIGAQQPVEMLNELTVNSGSEFYNETNNRAGSSQFNIRNLGLGSTLTLINGKRGGIAPVASAAGTDFVDINQYPLSMIQRIDVLTDGASATYGSQAVAGVANIITRKGFEGLELSGGYSDGEVDAWDISLAAGAGHEKGHFNVYATYYEQGKTGRTGFDWLDSRLNGNGNQARSRFLSGTGSPGSVRRAILASNGEAADATEIVDNPDYDPNDPDSSPTITRRAPNNPDPDCEAAGGVIGDPNDTGLAADTCRYNFADQVSVISAVERAQVFAEWDWELSDSVRYYSEASFSNNKIFDDAGGQLLSTGKASGGGVTILPSHPFNFYVEDPNDPVALMYIGPDAWDPAIHCTDINSSDTCQYQTATLRSIHRPLGASVTNTPLTRQDVRTMDYSRILTGFEIDLPNDWFLDVSYMWAKSQRVSVGSSAIRSDTYQQLVRDGTWNPFGTRITDPGLVSPKDGTDTANCFNSDFGACTAGNSLSIRDQWNGRSVSNATASEKVVDAVASGELFDIGNNTVAVAVGAQFRDVEYESNPDSLSAAGEDGQDSTASRVRGRQDVMAFFAEAVMPINDIGEIQLAIRNEDYGSGVSTTDPKASFEFGITESLGVRGSWGTSFQAPTVRQTGQATSSAFIDDVASATGPGGSIVCNDTDVSNNISVIVEGAPGLKPQEAENFNLGLIFQTDSFRASLDYFTFDYTDLIAAEAGAQAIVESQCAGRMDTGQPIIQDPRVTRDATGQVREVRSQFVNIGAVETQGLDFNADYSLEWGNATVMFDAGATYVLGFDVDADGDGTKEFDGVGSRNQSNSFSTMPELRANLGATYFNGNHTARLGINHIGGYDNDQGNNAPINSWTVWDAIYSYTFSGLIGDGETTLSIGMNNIFDEDPPALYRDDDLDGVPDGRIDEDGLYNRGWVDRPGYDDRAGHDLRGRITYIRFKHLF